MRPPVPSLNLSRRAKAALWTAGVLIVLIIALVQLSGVYVNFLWFGSVGQHEVYATIFWTRTILFLVFGLLMALIIGGNLIVARVLSPPFRPMSPEQQNIERYRAVLEPRRYLVLGAVGVVAFFSAGIAEQGSWQTWQLWLNGGSFGETDPQFHKDISFYAWDYPVYRLLLGFGFTAIIFSIILSAVVHYLTGAIRLQTPGPKVTAAARRHLTVLAFVFVVLKAIAYWLDRYGLVFSDRSKFTGASYTDVHAVLPARTILFWIALVIAAGLIASLWLRSTLLPGTAFIAMLVLSILISGIYPAILQQVSVKPNAQTKEAPYIQRNINATRAGYDIQTHTAVTYVNNYPALTNPNTKYITDTNPTVADIRILDPNVLSPTFTQQQQIRNVYGFPDKLDVDRYTIDGQTRDYVVSVRELDATNLSGDQNNWINQHTVYTHGYGFVAAAADIDVTTNPGSYTEKDIPPTGPLGLTQPAVYYGELLPNYSIVGAKGSAQEYNGSDSAKVTYAGGGGVSLGNLFTRLAFAVDYKQTNFVLNDKASADGAHVIFNRDPRVAVQKIAPFLHVDGDPYPFVDSKTGHIMWMVDGYTTMDNFPYSERQSLSALTDDTLAANNETAKQPDDEINYIRNSVKATVDAYTGKVTLYDWDDQDPVLSAWRKVFPGLIQDGDTMPPTVRAHVRYPEDLFEIQRSLIGSYHVDNPITFYNVGDKWTVPVDPDPTAAGASQPPYYVLASDPSTPLNAVGTPEFQLTSPMIVNGKTNLAAYISVDSDPGANYGKFTVLRVPNSAVTKGPEQVSNLLKTDPTITKDLSLFNSAGGGSTIVYGNLLTLPVGDSFLYVEPLYIQASGGNGSYPTLQRVFAYYNGSQPGYGSTLGDALANLSDKTVGRNLNTTRTTTTPTTTPTSTPSATSTPTSSATAPSVSTNTGGAVTLPQVNTAFAKLQAAYKTGDPAIIGAAEKNLQDLVQRYEAASASNSPSTRSSSTARASTSPGKSPSSKASPSTSARSSP